MFRRPSYRADPQYFSLAPPPSRHGLCSWCGLSNCLQSTDTTFRPIRKDWWTSVFQSTVRRLDYSSDDVKASLLENLVFLVSSAIEHDLPNIVRYVENADTIVCSSLSFMAHALPPRVSKKLADCIVRYMKEFKARFNTKEGEIYRIAQTLIKAFRNWPKDLPPQSLDNRCFYRDVASLYNPETIELLSADDSGLHHLTSATLISSIVTVIGTLIRRSPPDKMTATEQIRTTLRIVLEHIWKSADFCKRSDCLMKDKIRKQCRFTLRRKQHLADCITTALSQLSNHE